MEVWALEAYGAAYILQELLTVKSDDVDGRTKIYEAMVKGENILEPGTPVAFGVLCNELVVSASTSTSSARARRRRCSDERRPRHPGWQRHRTCRNCSSHAFIKTLSSPLRGSDMAETIYEKINDYAAVKIKLASPKTSASGRSARSRSPRRSTTGRTVREGRLFCERIFGPEKDWECSCGKYKGIKHKGIICDKLRREGHAQPRAPQAHGPHQPGRARSCTSGSSRRCRRGSARSWA
jgi:hypothetical protein